LCQAYPHLGGIAGINQLSFPEFNLYLLCMYNFFALKQGVDPEKPREDQDKDSGGRKVSRGEFAAMLQELEKKKQANKEE